MRMLKDYKEYQIESATFLCHFDIKIALVEELT